MSGASELLLSIVNDILDLTKLQSGSVHLERIEFSPTELLEAILAGSSSRILEKPLDLGLMLTPSCPAVLVGDPHRLHQVLLNLISNAIKFSEAGSVTVIVEAGPVCAFSLDKTRKKKSRLESFALIR